MSEFNQMTRETVDQIIFAMENQAEEFLIDIREGTVIPPAEAEDQGTEPSSGTEYGARFYPVPPWTPADGFRLMERFALTLKNPLYREALKECLSAGHGVFRRFKDTLKERPDIERLWFSFKYREMRRYIAEWLCRQEESYSLENMGPEPAETEDLILEDFTLRRLEPGGTGPDSGGSMGEESEFIDYIRLNDRKAFMEAFSQEPAAYAEALYRDRRGIGLSPEGDSRGGVRWGGEGFMAVAGASPSGDPAGFLWGCCHHLRSSGEELILVQLKQIFVEAEFRGLGLAKEMLAHFLEMARERGADRIDWQIPREGFFLDALMERFGFAQAGRTYSMDCFEELPDT